MDTFLCGAVLREWLLQNGCGLHPHDLLWGKTARQARGISWVRMTLTGRWWLTRCLSMPPIIPPLPPAPTIRSAAVERHRLSTPVFQHTDLNPTAEDMA
jgi:hypothetical protein